MSAGQATTTPPTPPSNIGTYGRLAKTLWFTGVALQVVGAIVVGYFFGVTAGVETVAVGGGTMTIGTIAHAVYDH